MESELAVADPLSSNPWCELDTDLPFVQMQQTVMLKKGEMLIHPGNLKHQGMDVSSGVRHILVAFMSSQWKAKHSVYSSCLRGS